jgi:hypothetical protein
MLLDLAQYGLSNGSGTPAGIAYDLYPGHGMSFEQLMGHLLPTFATAGAGAVAWAAFAFFGKRRRDDGESDEELIAAAAASGYEAMAASGLTAVDESMIPRWRRPSLQQVRRTDPLRISAEAPRMSFESAGVRPLENFERRHIGYRLVRLLDSPDELRSTEIGVLDQGDEVQLLQRHGAYWLVLCPDGRQGWVHRMTLAVPVESGLEIDELEPLPQYPIEEETEEVVAYGEEPSTGGLLEAYMKARSDVLRDMADGGSAGGDQAVMAESGAEAAAILETPTATEPEATAVVASEPETPVEAATSIEAETQASAPPAAEPARAGERYSGRKTAGTRKAATASRPGTKSRRPSR